MHWGKRWDLAWALWCRWSFWRVGKAREQGVQIKCFWCSWRKKVIVDNMILDHNIVTNNTNRSMHKQKGVDFTRGINFSVWTVIENFERYLSPVEGSRIRRRESGRAGGARPDPRPPWKTGIKLTWQSSQFQKSHQLVANDVVKRKRHNTLGRGSKKKCPF